YILLSESLYNFRWNRVFLNDISIVFLNHLIESIIQTCSKRVSKSGTAVVEVVAYVVVGVGIVVNCEGEERVKT
ncbi:hypothetical protein Tco_0423768, partial [Tanacetum coccineum]